jgi:hypothetical protein
MKSILSPCYWLNTVLFLLFQVEEEKVKMRLSHYFFFKNINICRYKKYMNCIIKNIRNKEDYILDFDEDFSFDTISFSDLSDYFVSVYSQSKTETNEKIFISSALKILSMWLQYFVCYIINCISFFIWERFEFFLFFLCYVCI